MSVGWGGGVWRPGHVLQSDGLRLQATSVMGVVDYSRRQQRSSEDLDVVLRREP